jgi:hypothetical protein
LGISIEFDYHCLPLPLSSLTPALIYMLWVIFTNVFLAGWSQHTATTISPLASTKYIQNNKTTLICSLSARDENGFNTSTKFHACQYFGIFRRHAISRVSYQRTNDFTISSLRSSIISTLLLSLLSTIYPHSLILRYLRRWTTARTVSLSISGDSFGRPFGGFEMLIRRFMQSFQMMISITKLSHDANIWFRYYFDWYLKYFIFDASNIFLSYAGCMPFGLKMHVDAVAHFSPWHYPYHRKAK